MLRGLNGCTLLCTVLLHWQALALLSLSIFFLKEIFVGRVELLLE